MSREKQSAQTLPDGLLAFRAHLDEIGKRALHQAPVDAWQQLKPLLENPEVIRCLPFLSNAARVGVFLTCTFGFASDEPWCAPVLSAVCAAGIDAKAPGTANGSVALFCAISDQNKVAFDWLLPQTDLSAVNLRNENALAFACGSTIAPSRVQALLAAGCDPNHASEWEIGAYPLNEYALTPLHAQQNTRYKTSGVPLARLIREWRSGYDWEILRLLLPLSNLFHKGPSGESVLSRQASVLAGEDDPDDERALLEEIIGLMRAKNAPDTAVEIEALAQAGIEYGEKEDRGGRDYLGLSAMFAVFVKSNFLPAALEERVYDFCAARDCVPPELAARHEARELGAIVADAGPASAESATGATTTSGNELGGPGLSRSIASRRL